MASIWDCVYEKIAGTGPARRHNLEKCKKELRQSCVNYERNTKRNPPCPHVTPSDEASARKKNQSEEDHMAIKVCGYQRLTEWAHNPHVSRPPSLNLEEEDILQRSRKLQADADMYLEAERKKPSMALATLPVAPSDPLEGYTATDFTTDSCIDDLYDSTTRRTSASSLNKPKASQCHPNGYTATRFSTRFAAEERGIKETAARMMAECRVRDAEPYQNNPCADELHYLRTRAWEAHLSGPEADVAQSSSASPDSVTVTADGCIIQHGFNLSPIEPSLKAHVSDKERTDSGCQIGPPAREEKARARPSKNATRNTKGVRIPLYFRKREPPTQRRTSTLSGIISGPITAKTGYNSQQAAQRSQYQGYVSQQRRQIMVARPPVVFFTGSCSSNAVTSDSEDEDEDLIVAGNSMAFSPTSSDDESDIADKDGSNTPAPFSKVRGLKTQRRVPQPPGEPTPQPSRIPITSVRQNGYQPPMADTPRPSPVLKQQQSKPTTKHNAYQPPRTGNLRPTLPQQHQQPRSTLQGEKTQPQKPPSSSSPQAQPCTALQRPIDHNIFNVKPFRLPRILAKVEGVFTPRSPNWQWNHVAPLYGFSVSKSYVVTCELPKEVKV